MAPLERPSHLDMRASLVGALAAISLPLASLMAPATAAPSPAPEGPRAQSAPAGGRQPADGLTDIDRRHDHGRYRPTQEQRRALARLGDDIVVGWSATGTASSLSRLGGTLTDASSGSPEAVARAFLSDNPTLFGLSATQVASMELTLLDEQSGAHTVRLEQRSDGREVYGANALVSIDQEGRVVLAGGDLVPDAGTAPGPSLAAEQAVAVAGASVAPREDPDQGRALGARDGALRFANTLTVPDYDGAPVEADLVTVATEDGARTAWRVLADRASNAAYTVLVDARSGEVLLRENGVSSDGPQGTVFTGDDPEAGGRSVQAFPPAWVSGETTSGENTNTYQDADADNTPAAGDQPQASDQHFDYAWNDPWGAGTGAESDLPLTGADRDAVVAQLFYYTNWIHDYAEALGFDNGARNFEGADPVLAETDADFLGTKCDSSGTAVKCLNNANFWTSADGSAGSRMQMYVGDTTNPDGTPRRTQRANNRDTVIHEYAHGITGRIISNGNLAGDIQSKSLGEGWSDAFATSINNDPVYGEYNSGDYANGIRGVAYDDDNLEYGDFSGTSEHSNGRIWSMAMWEARTALRARLGNATGKATHEQLLMTGIKNTPDTPSFHDARTGYLTADALENPHPTEAGIGENWCLLWSVFADNELGVTAAADPDTANAGSLTISTDTPDACDPNAAIAAVPDTDEGTAITFDASGTTVGGDPGDTVTYAWDMDDDGQYDDATGVSPSWTYGDNGSRTVGLRVTNSSGQSDDASVTFDTLNVSPTVNIDLADLAGMDEGDTRTVAATFSDPGWLDTYTGNVDLGTGALADVTPTVSVTTSGSAGTPDQGVLSAAVAYGDNGTYTVTVSVTDDDSGAGNDDAPTTVLNVDPTAVIDPTGEQVYDGVSAFILKAGQSLTIPVGSEDPGSDDLGFTWDWDGPLAGITPSQLMSLVNPPAADPALSPTQQPRDVDLSAAHTYGDACLYELEVEVEDDDSGVAADAAAVVVTGTATVSKGHGWWLNEYRPKGTTFTPAQLQCYLDIVNHLSMVFSEDRAATNRAQATAVLNAPAKAPQKVIFDQHALGAWLNFANGSVTLTTPVDTNRDGIADSTFGAVMLTAETVRRNPASSSAQVKAQKTIVERIALQSGP